MATDEDSVPPDEDVPVDRAEIQRRAVQGVGWTLVHTVVSIPVAFVVNLVVARVLGVVDYGRLAYLSTVIDLAGAVLSVGLGAALVQFGARQHAARRYGDVEHLLSISQGFRLFIATPILIVVVLLLVDVPPLLMVFAIVFGVVVPNGFAGASTALVLTNRTATDARLAIIRNLVTQGVVVTAVLLAQQADAVWASRIAIVGLASALVLIPLLPRYRRAVLLPRWPRGFPKGFWRFAIPTGASMVIAQIVVTRTEVVFLEWLSTPEAVGVFALAFGVAGTLFAPAQSITGPLIPALSSIAETADTATMARAFSRTIRVSATVSALIAAAGVPALAMLVPLLYGSAYAAAALPVVVLGCIGAVSVATTPVIAFALARLSAKRLLIVNVIALLVNVGLAVALIPALGVWGAVAASGVGVLLRMSLLLGGEARVLGLAAGRVVGMLLPLVIGVAAAWAVWGVMALLAWPTLVEAVVGAVGGLAMLVTGLRLSAAGLESHDVEVITNASPRKARTAVRVVLAPLTKR